MQEREPSQLSFSRRCYTVYPQEHLNAVGEITELIYKAAHEGEEE